MVPLSSALVPTGEGRGTAVPFGQTNPGGQSPEPLDEEDAASQKKPSVQS